jgi:phage shock protein A
MLNKLRQDVAEVLTAKKRLEMQKAKLWHYIHTLQARRSLDSNMVDIAKVALQRKNANLVKVLSLDKLIPEMQAEQVKLEEAGKRLSTKVDEFRSIKKL